MRLTIDPRVMRFAPRIPRAFPYGWVEVLLVVVLAVQSARLVWAAFAPLGPIGNWVARPATSLPSDAGILTRFDPFFRLSGQPGTTVVTSLPLKLFGVRVDQATGRGSAIIATPDGLQSSFAVDDEIMPGVKLKAVAQDNVTIDRGGSSEQLFLDQSVPAVVTSGAGAGAPPPPGPPPAPSPDSTGTASLRSGVSFAPRMVKGAVSGFVITPNGSGDAFRTAGFQPGDVVTAINGTALQSVQDAAAAVANLPANGIATFQVERGGKVITLSTKAGQ